MNAGELARCKDTRSIAAVLAVVLAFSLAAVAVASSTHARLETQQGKRGTMLAGGNGHTLYMFTLDQGGKSSCYSSCAQVWHPDYTHGKPVVVAGSAVNPKLVGTTKRRSGALQVTYNGHPLYFYSGDSNPGDMHGENLPEFGGYWYVVGPGGHPKKPVVFNPGAY